MTKRVPQRYPRGKPVYVRPRNLPRGSIPGRFEVARPHPPQPKSLKQLAITFTPEGKVRLPRYQEKENNPMEIERVQFIELPNPYTAVRFSRHQFESISTESRALDAVTRQVVGVHRAIQENWSTYNVQQRAAVRNFLVALAGALGDPNQLQSYFKRRAQARLARAAELLSKRNVGAAVVSLVGSTADFVRRKNQLVRQRDFIDRRHRELGRETRVRQGRLDDYITAFQGRMDVLHHPLTSREQANQILEELRSEYRSMMRKDESELREATRFIVEAGKLIKEGNWSAAREPLRKVNRLVVLALSRQFLFGSRNIAFVQLSSDSSFRRRAWENQLFIVADNIGFWFARARDRSAMADHLSEFARAAERDLAANQVQALVDASRAIRRGSGSLAEEKLMQLFVTEKS